MESESQGASLGASTFNTEKSSYVNIRRAGNGFILNQAGSGKDMIANTLAEALELARKIME